MTVADSVSKRFWAKVDRTETCWLWTASQNGRGYGQFRLDGRPRAAHRLAYEMLVGQIPEGLELDHLCRVPNCVNPRHLEPVTHQVNMSRGQGGWHNREKTHCPQGHPYDEENTHLYKGGRWCRACERVRSSARRQKAISEGEAEQ